MHLNAYEWNIIGYETSDVRKNKFKTFKIVIHYFSFPLEQETGINFTLVFLYAVNNFSHRKDSTVILGINRKVH